jgi:hypothetical protein
MGNPTPAVPIVVNDDGTVSMLVYQGRTLRLNATHEGLTDPTGYKARFALTDKYGNAVIASADSEDGDIVITPVLDPTPPNDPIATLFEITISDETMETVVAKGGKMDMVLEEPGGAEIPFFVGDWVLYKQVSP